MDKQPTAESNWHGWLRVSSYEAKSTDLALHIGPLPGRKRVALYLETTEGLEPLAYFQSTDAASLAMLHIDHLVQPK